VFALLFLMDFRMTVCSTDAFVAGGVPHWILNRGWTRKIEDNLALQQEIVAYLLMSLIALFVSSLATGWTLDHLRTTPPDHGIRVILVTATYALVLGVLFVGKSIVSDRIASAHRRS
jgi:hypothetical protein